MSSPSAPEPSRLDRSETRWQAFLQRSPEPLFLLNQERRLVFVNRAWEALVGLAQAEARLLRCTLKKPASPEDVWEEVVRHVLCPPPEVLDGRAARRRRLLPANEPGRRWWDVEFLPFRNPAGRPCVLGKITPVAEETGAAASDLSEKLASLRERVAGRHRLDLLPDALPSMRRLAEQVRLAARTRLPALLVGERGAGKRWLARAVHYLGPGCERGFAALDCARLPPPALADALFGAGGLLNRPGVGTLYLREPSGLPRELQARLAGWAADPGPDAPRLLAGCADAAADLRDGRLLDELHGAVSALVLPVPPLRERLADLPRLTEQLLADADAAPDGEGPKRVAGLAADAWAVVRAYSWPGNLRELAEVLASARGRAKGDRIAAADLPLYLRLPPAPAPPRPLPLKDLLEETERRLLLLALRLANGKTTRAAELLSVRREHLWRRLKALRLTGPEEADVELDEARE